MIFYHWECWLMHEFSKIGKKLHFCKILGHFWANFCLIFGKIRQFSRFLAILKPLLVTKRAKTGGNDYDFHYLHTLNGIWTLVNSFSLHFPVWVFANFVKAILEHLKIIDFFHRKHCHELVSNHTVWQYSFFESL